MTSPPSPKAFYSYFRGYMGMVEFDRARGIDLRAAEVNAARIYDRLCVYFDALGEEALRPWFREHDEQLLFDFFVETRKVDLSYFATSVDESVLSAARAAGRVLVYGAGVVGRRVVNCLGVNDVPIDGVVVSQAEGNPAVLCGHRVSALADVDGPHEGDLVVVAVSMKFKDEVDTLLDDAGWPHLHYLDVMA